VTGHTAGGATTSGEKNGRTLKASKTEDESNAFQRAKSAANQKRQRNRAREEED